MTQLRKWKMPFSLKPGDEHYRRLISPKKGCLLCLERLKLQSGWCVIYDEVLYQTGITIIFSLKTKCLSNYKKPNKIISLVRQNPLQLDDRILNLDIFFVKHTLISHKNACGNFDLLFHSAEWKNLKVLIAKFAQFLITTKNLTDIAKQNLFVICPPIFYNCKLYNKR